MENENAVSEKSPAGRKTMLALICLFTGYLGIHRFMTGKWKSGLLQMFTLGGFYIWWLIDTVCLFTGNFADTDGELFKVKIYKHEHPNATNEELAALTAKGDSNSSTGKNAKLVAGWLFKQFVAPNLHSKAFGGGTGTLYFCVYCKAEFRGNLSIHQKTNRDYCHLAPDERHKWQKKEV